MYNCDYYELYGRENAVTPRQSKDYKEKQVDEKYRKVFVTAHVVLRTAAMFPASALNRRSHLLKIRKNHRIRNE